MSAVLFLLGSVGLAGAAVSDSVVPSMLQCPPGTVLLGTTNSIPPNPICGPAPTLTPTKTGVACPLIAMQCPDGSYVAAQGPTCAFAACPPVRIMLPTTTSCPLVIIDGVIQHSCDPLPPVTQNPPSSVSPAPKYPELRAITVNLGMGSKGNEVAILQQFLISRSGNPAAYALQAVGATGYFGALTRQALAAFQAAVKISPALGNFGSITRAYISAYY